MSAAAVKPLTTPPTTTDTKHNDKICDWLVLISSNSKYMWKIPGIQVTSTLIKLLETADTGEFRSREKLYYILHRKEYPKDLTSQGPSLLTHRCLKFTSKFDVSGLVKFYRISEYQRASDHTQSDDA
jgi:hypothetical protein